MQDDATQWYSMLVHPMCASEITYVEQSVGIYQVIFAMCTIRTPKNIQLRLHQLLLDKSRMRDWLVTNN